ncbi:hypothetical protein [Clostridium sp. JNZ J1-5]
MGKKGNHITLLILSLFMLATFIGCADKNDPKDTFYIEQFQSEMKAKNYKFQMQDVEKSKHFLPTTRKKMIFDNEALYIYLFNSNEKMENEAKRIDSDGCGYSDGSKSMAIDWISSPHFYKKGNIIVQYVGKDEKIISDLEDILGNQFAGERDVREIAYNQLTSKDKERVVGTWRDSKLSKTTLKESMGNIYDKSYIGKEVYLVDFPRKSESKLNNMIVYISIDNYKLIGHGHVD